jgi:hypothetical protein
MNGRNELLPDPFDEFDPHHGISSKKAFNPNVVKCLQSRINLKNDAAEMLVRPKLPNVNASVIAVHNQQCREHYTRNLHNKRWTYLHGENPFTEGNKPPIDHLIPDKICEKPCKITNLAQYRNDQPLAGKLSEVGDKILELGHKRANMIQTGPWGEIQIKDSAKQLAQFEKGFT